MSLQNLTENCVSKSRNDIPRQNRPGYVSIDEDSFLMSWASQKRDPDG